MHPPDADLQTRLTGRRPPRWAWLLALLLPLVASAQVPAPEAPDLVLAASAKYRSIKQLAEETEAHGRSRLVELVGQLDGIRLTASQCADDAAAGLARLARQSAALNLTGKPASATAAPGEPGKPPAAPPVPDTTAAELPGLATLRAELAAQRAALESREATCRLLELNSTELSSELSRREQQLAASALLVRTPDVLQVVRQNLGQVHQWSVAGTTLLRLVTGVEELGWIHFGGLLAVSLLAALLAGTWRRQPLRAEDSQGTLPFTT
ncbi:MAG TPA: hypothetical protein VIX81_11220, partial [Gammaproteobacteria bacterium]